MDKKIYDFFMNVDSGAVTDAMYMLNLEGWTECILPLKEGTRVFGPAFTVKATHPRDKAEKGFAVYDIYDKWKPGDVLLIDGLDSECSLMGGNIAHIVQMTGAAGIVLNGRCRDIDEIKDMDFPVFGKGPAMRLKKGIFKYTQYNVPMEFAGAHVEPGDYVLGDSDGVLVFPAKYAEEIMFLAEGIQDVENRVAKAIKKGENVDEIIKILKTKNIPRKH